MAILEVQFVTWLPPYLCLSLIVTKKHSWYLWNATYYRRIYGQSETNVYLIEDSSCISAVCVKIRVVGVTRGVLLGYTHNCMLKSMLSQSTSLLTMYMAPLAYMLLINQGKMNLAGHVIQQSRDKMWRMFGVLNGCYIHNCLYLLPAQHDDKLCAWNGLVWLVMAMVSQHRRQLTSFPRRMETCYQGKAWCLQLLHPQLSYIQTNKECTVLIWEIF